MKLKIKKSGFTLVEVLLVVVLIFVLVSMVLMATNSSRLSSEGQLTKATLELLDTALLEYHDYTNGFPEPNSMGPSEAFDSDYSRRNASLYAQLNLVPDSKKVLGKIADSQTRLVDELVSFTDHWMTIHEQQGYLLILDAWKMPLDYKYEPGDTFPLITSAGPDRNFDMDDDNIKNIK